MIAPQRTGSRLLLPLRRLAETPGALGPARTLDLDAQLHGAVATWLPAVRAAAEACLLLDSAGRITASSPSASGVLGAPPAEVIGATFVDVVAAMDLSSGGAPDPEPERSLPPLRALATGGLARGLLRLRPADGPPLTYDVVAVPLAGGGGVLAFFLAV